MSWAVLIAALALVAWAPWWGPGITRPFPGMVIALGGLLSLLVGIALVARPPARRAWPVLGVATALVAWLTLSSFQSMDAWRSTCSLSAWVVSLALLYGLCVAIRTREHWRLAAHVMLLGATVLSAYALIVGNPAATFSNRDTFSLIPLIAFMLSLGLYSSADERVRVVLMLQTFICVAGVLLSTSRAALLGLILGILFFGWAVRKRIRGRVPMVLLLFIGLAVFFLLAYSGLLSPVSQRLSAMAEGQDSQGVTMRKDVLVHGVRASFARPVLGSGPGTFALAYQQFRPLSEVPPYIYVNVAHNDHVEMLVEGGWVAFGLWLALLFLAVSRALRFIARKHMVWESAAAAAAIVAAVGFALLNFAVAIPSVLLWWFAAIGLAVAIPVPGEKSEGPLLGRLAMASLLMLAGVACAQFGLRTEKVNGLAARAQDLADRLRWEQAEEALQEAIALQPRRPGLFVQLGRLRAQLGFLEEDPKRLEQAGQDFATALKFSPRDSKTWFESVRFYRQAGKLDEAAGVLARAREYAPYQDAVLREQVAIYTLEMKLAPAADALFTLTEHDRSVLKGLVETLANIAVASPSEAVKLLQGWHKRDPELAVEVARQAAEALLARPALEAAAAVLGFLAHAIPEDLAVVYMQAQAAAAIGDEAEQRRLLDKILNSPTPPETLASRALADWAHLNGRESIPRLQEYLKNNSRAVEVRLILSNLLMDGGQDEKARGVIDEGLTAYPDEPRLLARMGTLFLRAGSDTVAESYFQRALEADPANAEAREGLQGLEP